MQLKEAAEETGGSEKKMRSFEMVNSVNNDMMQTQDFVANSVGNYAMNEKKWANQLRMKIREAIRN
jgi:hypothetical protein